MKPLLTTPNAAFFLMMMLGGCGTYDSRAEINLPVMPADLSVPCIDPGVRASVDARIELARNRRALGICTRRHGDAVKFYDHVRREF